MANDKGLEVRITLRLTESERKMIDIFREERRDTGSLNDTLRLMIRLGHVAGMTPHMPVCVIQHHMGEIYGPREARPQMREGPPPPGGINGHTTDTDQG